MTCQQLKEDVRVLKAQVKALLEPMPKIIDQSVFTNASSDIVGAYITSLGEGRLTKCPAKECEFDGDSWSTPMDYGSGISLGFGYDPRGWQKSYTARKLADIKPSKMRKVRNSRKQYSKDCENHKAGQDRKYKFYVKSKQ